MPAVWTGSTGHQSPDVPTMRESYRTRRRVLRTVIAATGSSALIGTAASQADDDGTHTLEIEVLSGTPNPIAGAPVTVDGQTVQTDEEGIVTFELDPGTYTVEVAPEGHEAGAREVTLDGDESVRFVLPRILDAVEIVDHEVFVTETDDGEELINVRATVENRHDHGTGDMELRTTVYDADGEEFEGRTAGDLIQLSVAPNSCEEVETAVYRSGAPGTEFGEIGSYEIVLYSLEVGTVDQVSAEYEGDPDSAC